MINVDPSSEQNRVTGEDWHSQDAVRVAPDAPKRPNTRSTRAHPKSSAHHTTTSTTEPVTPADAEPIIALPQQNESPETPGDVLPPPNEENESASSLSAPPSPDVKPSSSGESIESLAVKGSAGASDAPKTDADGTQAPHASRQSTPLTDLSAAPSPSRQNGDDAPSSVKPRPKEAVDGVTPAGMDKKTDAHDLPLSKPHPNGVAPSPSRPSADPPSTAEDKVALVLQLNSELLKVCIEFQTRQMLQSSEFGAYATRLQSNLAWLAAAADRQRPQVITLPTMTAPPVMPWVSMDAINDMYNRLPALFAKDIAKRQREQATQASLKRTAEQSLGDEHSVSRKRVDTGESKNAPLAPFAQAASPPRARSTSIVSNGTAASTPATNLSLAGADPQSFATGMMGVQQPPALQRMPSAPELLPHQTHVPHQPALLPGTTNGMTEAQMQMRRSSQQMFAQQQQQQQKEQAQRMPPPQMMPNGLSGSATTPSALMHSNAAQAPQLNNVNTQAILQALGPGGVQCYQMLQTPGHQFVAYMVQTVPGFLQLPLQQQLQRMVMIQRQMQSMKQQAQAQAQSQATPGGSGGGVAGMSNMNGLTNDGHPQISHSGSGGFPLQQQPNMGGQPMVPAANRPGPSTMQYPVTNGMNINNPQLATPQRPGTVTPQQMQQQAAAMNSAMGGMGGMNQNNLTQQQRQFMLLQSMQQRGAEGAINPQAFLAAQQEKLRQEQQSRMSNPSQHASPPQSAGSPTSGMNMMGMPGIARSTRSPSASEAPMTPRMQQKRPETQYPQAMFQQQQAQQAQQQAQQARQAAMMQQGAAMSGISPQQMQAQMQQMTANGGINPAMVLSGGGMQQNPGWGQQHQQQQIPQQQQQFSISPAQLQHHPDVGTPRPPSSASNAAMGPPSADVGGDTFDPTSLFNWNMA